MTPLARALRGATTILLALGGTTLLGACDLILRATSADRHFDPTIDCSTGDCVCKPGLGDCDGDVDNGCETTLDQSPNCGACGATCTNAACVGSACQCNPGFADCDDDKTNGCEATLATDTKNCGACRRDCGTSACVDGACGPTTIGTVAGATTFTVGTGSVYVALCNAVGPAAVVFSPGQSMFTPAVEESGCAHAISVAGTFLVWTSDTAVLSTPILGTVTKAIQIAATSSHVTLLATGPSNAYWWDAPAAPAPHVLLRADLTGGSPVTIAQAEVTALAADFSQAYWSDENGLHTVPHNGTSPILLDGTIHATALAVGPETVYASDGKSVYAVPINGLGQTQVLTATSEAGALAADNLNVYWTDTNDMTLREMPSQGGTVTVLAANEAFAHGFPIFSYDQLVYWMAGNDVRSVPR